MSHRQSTVTNTDIRTYLLALEYPVDKEYIIDYAQEHSADEQTLDMLNNLPVQEYESPTDVVRAMNELELFSDEVL